MRRVEMLRDLLGHDSIQTANMFSLPTLSVLDINRFGRTPEPWLVARHELADCIDSSSEVLLAYGVQSPTGLARSEFQRQVTWMWDRLRTRDCPTWTVGNSPRHPSRWQRLTARDSPGTPFPEAVLAALSPATLKPKV